MKEDSWEHKSLERPISAPAQLLVEGRTPEIFFRELVEELGFSERVDVRTFGSINNLQTWMELFVAKAAFKERVTSVAVIRDAEAEPAVRAFESVCSALSATGFPVPTAMQNFTTEKLRVGVYILPDCSRPGMLETLCLDAVAEHESNSPTKLLPCVDDFFHCIGTTTEFENEVKARLSCYVLARGVVDPPQLGRAAQKRVIPCRTTAFASVVEFLKRLAN